MAAKKKDKLVEKIETILTQLTNGKKCSKEVLLISIDEQRRVYDELNEYSNQVKVKILTLLGAGLALLTFLYANPSDKENPLFIPPTLYGKIFYVAGIVLTLGALSILLYATKPGGEHEVPTEVAVLKDLDTREEYEFLEYVNDRYIACYKVNVSHYQSKYKLLNIAFLPLVFGAIILIVLKIFGT